MAVSPIQSRLLGGRSTPAIRAILPPLSLALAVLGVGTDHPHHAAPMNDLGLHANVLSRCPDLHDAVPSRLTPTTCTGTRCGLASGRRVKAPRPRGRPAEPG